MMVDTSKHKYAHYSFLDIELHCVCGAQFQAGDVGDDGKEFINVCPKCGQKWSTRVLVIPVLEFAHMDYSDTKAGEQ